MSTESDIHFLLAAFDIGLDEANGASNAYEVVQLSPPQVDPHGYNRTSVKLDDNEYILNLYKPFEGDIKPEYPMIHTWNGRRLEDMPRGMMTTVISELIQDNQDLSLTLDNRVKRLRKDHSINPNLVVCFLICFTLGIIIGRVVL